MERVFFYKGFYKSLNKIYKIYQTLFSYMIKIISFDMDNTLVNTRYDKEFWDVAIPKAYAAKYDVDLKRAQEIVFKDYEELLDKKHQDWFKPNFWYLKYKITKEDVLKHMLDIKNHVYEDVEDILKYLKGKYKLILVTHAVSEFIQLKLKDGLLKYFDKIYSCQDEPYSSYKDEDMYKLILSELNVDPCEICHIGDDIIFDKKVPESIGIKSILIDRKKGKGEIKSLVK